MIDRRTTRSRPDRSGARVHRMLAPLPRWALPSALVLLVGCGGGDGSEDAAARSRDAPGPVAWEEDVHEARRGVVEAGSTLQDALTGVGLDGGEALRLAAAVDTIWSVRSIRAGTPFILTVTRYGEPVAFELWPDAVEGVEARKNGGVWEAQPAERALDRHVLFLNGVVESSFYESIVNAGGNAELVLKVSDILQWDVDFFVDPRVGDRYAILVETWTEGRDVVRYGDILAIEYEGERVTARAFLHRSGTEEGYYTPEGDSVRRTLLKSPLNFRRISSHFSHSRFHPILHKYRPHLGVDYAADAGTPVVTIGDGKVVFAGTKGGYGKIVIVRHNARLTTQYAHLSRFGKGVRTGAHVDQGQVVGYVGSTGLSTGPHLDFRCKVNDSFVNPLTLERPPAEPVPASDRELFDAGVAAYRRACRELPRGGFIPLEAFRSTYGDPGHAQSVAGPGGKRSG